MASDTVTAVVGIVGSAPTAGSFAAVHDQTVCDDMQAWLGSVMRAFLDAYVREDPTAVAYLAGESVVEASDGVVEWDRK